MKWFYEASTCIVGINDYGTFETDDNDIGVAEDIGWEHALENALSYFSVIDENESERYEANGDEYMVNFIFDSDVYAIVTEYNAEKHDMYL